MWYNGEVTRVKKNFKNLKKLKKNIKKIQKNHKLTCDVDFNTVWLK